MSRPDCGRWRRPVALGGTIRLLYGLGALLAPSQVSGRIAPEIHGLPGPRMNLRGFGSGHIALAAFTLAATRSPRHAPAALALNAGSDVLDAAAAALELRARGGMDRVVAGGMLLPALGLATWSVAARRGALG